MAGESQKLYAEPARQVANWIAAVLAVVGLATAAVAETTDVLPTDWQPYAVSAGAVLTTVGVIGAKLQGILTRNRVWSPEHHYESVNEAAWISAVQTRNAVEAQPPAYDPHAQ